MKSILKEKAIHLRKQGLSYTEILKHVPVAKSTLGVWLHDVGLSHYQKQRLTEKKLASAKRGSAIKRQKRVEFTQKIIVEAKMEIGTISKRELWLIGTMLYWAEGAKEKEYYPGSGVRFTNTDPRMISIFLFWLKEICDKTLKDLIIDIYIHELHRDRKSEISLFWAETIGCDLSSIAHIYYKKGNPKTLRRNVDALYHGTVRIAVKSSSLLNRQIAGWVWGVIEST